MVKPFKNNDLYISGSLKFKKWRIEDVLEWQMGIAEINPLHIDRLTVSGSLKYPFYGQATTNKGIISHEILDKSVLNNPNGKPTLLIHSNNQNIVYLDTPFYLKDGHGATSVLQSKHLNRYTAFYLSGAIGKVIKAKFDYNAKATKIALKNTEIILPEKNGKPDYDLMAKIARAVEKTVIADVVAYANREMAAYKSVIQAA